VVEYSRRCRPVVPADLLRRQRQNPADSLSETIQIETELPLASIIARDPATGIGSLVTAATEANVLGILADHLFSAGSLNVVYVSGAFN